MFVLNEIEPLFFFYTQPAVQSRPLKKNKSLSRTFEKGNRDCDAAPAVDKLMLHIGEGLHERV